MDLSQQNDCHLHSLQRFTDPCIINDTLILAVLVSSYKLLKFDNVRDHPLFLAFSFFHKSTESMLGRGVNPVVCLKCWS